MLKRILKEKVLQGNYLAPSVELLEVKTEKGFAESFSKEEDEF